MRTRRIAWVTGAARGIGAATCLQMARRGYDLAVTDVEPFGLSAVATEARGFGAAVFDEPGDLADLAFLETFARRAVDRLGDPAALVNNAAWRELVTMREISIESWERTLRVCLTAPAMLARIAAARMEPLRTGVIVNISSMMSRQAGGIAPAYVAAKGGLDSLTFDLAALYGPSGIRVIAVNPGAVDTEPHPTASDVNHQVREWSEQMISLRRWATPEEIARAIVWVCSDEASYLSGTTLTLDGGWSRQLYPHDLKRAMRPEQFP